MKRVRQPAIETNAHRTMWSTMPRVPLAMPVWSQAWIWGIGGESMGIYGKWVIHGNILEHIRYNGE